jgi:hypothetical protein
MFQISKSFKMISFQRTYWDCTVEVTNLILKSEYWRRNVVRNQEATYRSPASFAKFLGWLYQSATLLFLESSSEGNDYSVACWCSQLMLWMFGPKNKVCPYHCAIKVVEPMSQFESRKLLDILRSNYVYEFSFGHKQPEKLVIAWRTFLVFV